MLTFVPNLSIYCSWIDVVYKSNKKTSMLILICSFQFMMKVNFCFTYIGTRSICIEYVQYLLPYKHVILFIKFGFPCISDFDTAIGSDLPQCSHFGSN